MQNVNRVLLIGNLTRDPELKRFESGTAICNMRLAVTGRIKRNDEWQDKPNYFTIVAFGASAENCEKYLSKGHAIAVDGRLDWREWDENGTHREAVQVVADTVQFLEGKREEGEREAVPAASVPQDDDIPF